MAEIELQEEKVEPAGNPAADVESDETNNSNAEDRHLAKNSRSDLENYRDGDVGVPTKKSGIPGATMNFVNSIIGAGIIGLPGALNKAGFCFGLFLMLLVAMMINYGVRHLVECGLQVRKRSYEETMMHVYGAKGFYMASAAISLFAYGAMVVYHIVIGDTIPKIFQTISPDSILVDRTLVVFLYSIIFMLPLSLLKNMASLEKTSALSFLCVIVIVVTVTIEGVRVSPYEDMSGLQANHLLINEQWFAGAGTMAFAFVCHHSSFVVYESLSNHTTKRWAITTHASIGISVFFSLWLSIAGFLSFQTQTDGDILNNFRYDNTAINVARGLLALTMVFTYPMELFVARYSVLQSLKLRGVIHSGNENIYFYTITFLLWSSSLLIGAFLSDLGVVLELIGVLCGAVVGFIFPGLVSLRVFGFHRLKEQMRSAYKDRKDNGKLYTCKEKYIATWNLCFPMFMIVFGCVIMIMG
eukprot:CAMPEP_0202707038 /NCGR_PEP_ID=MMETSP1385-20130828/19392_1 /ASSEMBLY_ACC=CAM_ASM_000861 /TAXON_ID=933848 /ORGANISM="Elphidium margaritaceum" /LENGTH=469 /DNA_ID=CAMNT_0049365653 /DNA_START=34 /DNA_END=1440 /DNA_ORIENTATION=-